MKKFSSVAVRNELYGIHKPSYTGNSIDRIVTGLPRVTLEKITHSLERKRLNNA